MFLPKSKSTEVQLKLFDADRLLKSDGELRWAVGDFYEEQTKLVSGAKRLVTDSRAYICPDLQFDPSTFFECKAVGKTGKAIFYTGRIERYNQFTASGYNIPHWIWSHRFKASIAKTYNELHHGLWEHTYQVMVLDYPTIIELLENRPQTLINSQYNKNIKRGGYTNNTEYGTGWTVPIRDMRERCFRINSLTSQIDVFASCQDFGRFFNGKTQQTSKGG